MNYNQLNMQSTLSQFLKKQKFTEKILIKLSNQPLIIDIIPQNISQRITTLSLNHCQIKSLSGIQQFNFLETLSLKYNDLNRVEELYKINNCSRLTLRSLDISGNQLEFSYQCTYIKLLHWIPNLEELNNNYYKNIEIKGKEKRNTKNIIKQINNVKNSIKKLNKIQEDQFIKNTNPNSMIMKRLKENNTKKELLKSEMWGNEEQKQNFINDISISNIAMTKSFRNEIDNANKRRNTLKINTSQVDNICPIPLTQPTATFARNKQLQESQILNFRTKNKSLYNSQVPQNYLQVSVSGTTKRLITGSVFEQIEQNIDCNMEDIAVALYQQSLISRAFDALQICWKRQMQMPKKSLFF